MANKKYIEKYIFLGDCNSINIEIIYKAFFTLKKNIKYIIIGNIEDIKRYSKKINSKIDIKEILDPYDFNQYNYDKLNVFNVVNSSSLKYKNLLNQLKIANSICNKSKRDLITMPINKSVFKKKINFTGITEYLAKLNKCKTYMLMLGEKFSVVPLTTHIKPKFIHKSIKHIYLNNFIKQLLKLVNQKKYGLKFKSIIFLCYNPHCGENETIGLEDKTIKDVIKKYKKIKGPFPADSSFINYRKNSLFISCYHDQGLIPFKTLNKKGINLTIGLNYRRLSPAHGTAENIKFKNLADITSYISCMQF
tara:strand:+ start:5473 stop:6390 length:918 start_codon:yes stop_codon:yes gene_type:complete